VTRLRDVVGPLLLQQAEALEADFRRIRSVADAETIHAARIDAKRLRYLLEPLAAEIDGGARLIARFKRMQDVFGEFTDAQVLARELADAARRIGGDWAAHATQQVLARSDEPVHEPQALIGVLLLATRVRHRQQQGFRAIRRYYLGTHAARLFAPIRRDGDSLVRQRGPRRRSH
jgi:CHAD domain-containing protein